MIQIIQSNMKKIAFLFLLFTVCNNKDTFSQKIEKADSLGLPGDNLNLYAVLDLFQKSKTFEEFEKQLNLEDSKINNLDLNNDDKTDYIKVIDHQTGESHAVVLQVLVSEKETQDVAVIEIEKDKSGKVLVQIVGNEELYGKDYIVEPTENDPTAKVADPNKKSDTTVTSDGKTVIINNTTNNYNTTTSQNNSPDTYVVVNQWPIIHYVYTPAYVVYVSPWHWYYYPSWWSPWSPWYWHSYYWHHYNYHHHHYGHYHRTNYYRAPNAHNYYGPRRSVSATVQQNRTSKVYQRTYTSKSRAGDGKIVPEKTNPAFKDKPRDTQANPDVKPKDDRPRGDNIKNQPDVKPNDTRPASKGDKRDNGNKPISKPRDNAKPIQKQTPKPSQRQNPKPSNKPAQRAPKAN
jgi:hypothetical protein